MGHPGAEGEGDGSGGDEPAGLDAAQVTSSIGIARSSMLSSVFTSQLY